MAHSGGSNAKTVNLNEKKLCSIKQLYNIWIVKEKEKKQTVAQYQRTR